MKPSLLLLLLLLNSSFISSQSEFGIYVTKEDYLNKKLTVVQNMIPTENFNKGDLAYKYKDKKTGEEKIEKINCVKEKYFGFRYVDSCDYMQMDGFYAKIVIVGRIDLLISPKAVFTVDKEGKYTFVKPAEGKTNFYFMKNLDPSTMQPFEKLVLDERDFIRKYQLDKDNYGEFINKQIHYLKKYNAIVPKVKPQRNKVK